ncbi:large conductance mechanosensitive channel protein MscL [Sphingobium sp. SA2]|uniref:large conductance mechanosensitive channel protein MscL n=1 Tax=Sphingobium sp. SA2 TaxID=1524832 RepID=UPI0008B308B0|nr:large conductance mechanosensitive channel protein MscL [Sphingobium sp. SA2]MDT7534741.1 large conductance mechanosensitive channel protein MscL [Sphingobium sp. SA2]OHC95351.1 MAG: large-conductance mechanosensitive channel protein [Sphingomonadales bacterium RIFCSPLOWO2_12_FULL_63_15]|tara:strand:+ start:83 stop:526 length:444 start_codon:yes stop_codon:yes gene_type:complete
MGLLSEFKTFINRGNVMDLAVGVIIGGAFATITKSLTDDLIMPVVGYIFGGADFSRYFIRMGDLPAGFQGNPESYADLKAAGVAMFGWGEFLTVLVNFMILAFIIFLLVKLVNRLTAKQEAEAPAAAPAPTPEDIMLLREIRDSLKK